MGRVVYLKGPSWRRWDGRERSRRIQGIGRLQKQTFVSPSILPQLTCKFSPILLIP